MLGRRPPLFLLVLVLVLVLRARAIAAGSLEDSVFDQSLALFRAKSYAAARDGFASYIDAVQAKDPKAPRLVEAIYYEAECRYLDGDKAGAHELYRKILDDHRNFPKIAEVINREYEIGTAFIEGKAKRPFLGMFMIYSESYGAEILEHLVESYQQKYFDNAQQEVADYYFRRHDWRKAADAYMALEQNFHESPFSGVAMYQRAICHLRLCRGYRYDQTEVIAAEAILVDYIKRNPTGNRIREAEQALDEIRAARAKLYAENCWFYLFRERRPRSALVYAEAIAREAPSAPAAKELPTILDEIARKADPVDPPTAARAKELLAEVEKRGLAKPGIPGPPSGPPTLVPGPVHGASKNPK
jgi:hypothetical protein